MYAACYLTANAFSNSNVEYNTELLRICDLDRQGSTTIDRIDNADRIVDPRNVCIIPPMRKYSLLSPGDLVRLERRR